MRIVGYNDQDMQLWLLIVRKLPAGKDIEMIGHKLSKTGEGKMWVNLYLSISCYYTV